MPSHLIGLLLGTEDDWPSAFESLLERLGPIEWHGQRHELTTERIVNEPFDLRYRPRYSLVIDRLAWWYDLPRAWLKKVALMDDVYLLNNPFTFQSMEKHSAYCAMMRLGLKVPDTWLIPHKVPTPIATFDYMAEKFPDVAARYNAPFDLDEIGGRVGYPLFMKPFDGGQWVGVSRVGSAEELRTLRRVGRADDAPASGDRGLRRLRALLSIGAETMVMRFEPDRPMHDRYQVEHGFLSPTSAGDRHRLAPRERVLPLGVQLVRDDRQGRAGRADRLRERVARRRDHVAALLLPVGDARARALDRVRARDRTADADRPRPREYFAIGDREDLSYDEKLRAYRRLADEYFEAARYEEFVEESLGQLDELTVDYFESQEFDDLLVQIVRSTFPEHEQEHFVEHYRGLVGAWAADGPQPDALGSSAPDTYLRPV